MAYSQIHDDLIRASVGAPRWALHVYAYLDARGGSRGWWITKQSAIAKAIGIGRQGVNEALRWLEAEGYLSTLPVNDRATRYEMSARATARKGDLSARATPAVGQGDSSRDRTFSRSKNPSDNPSTGSMEEIEEVNRRAINARFISVLPEAGEA